MLLRSKVAVGQTAHMQTSKLCFGKATGLHELARINLSKRACGTKLPWNSFLLYFSFFILYYIYRTHLAFVPQTRLVQRYQRNVLCLNIFTFLIIHSENKPTHINLNLHLNVQTRDHARERILVRPSVCVSVCVCEGFHTECVCIHVRANMHLFIDYFAPVKLFHSFWWLRPSCSIIFNFYVIFLAAFHCVHEGPTNRHRVDV